MLRSPQTYRLRKGIFPTRLTTCVSAAPLRSRTLITISQNITYPLLDIPCPRLRLPCCLPVRQPRLSQVALTVSYGASLILRGSVSIGTS